MHSKTLPQTEPVASAASRNDCAASLPDAATTSPTVAAPTGTLSGDSARAEIASDHATRHQMKDSPGGKSNGTSPTPTQYGEPETHAVPRSPPATIPAGNLALFVARVRELLDAKEEPERRQLKSEVLSLAVPLQASGMFEILNIVHPALATMVSDHLAESATAQAAARD